MNYDPVTGLHYLLEAVPLRQDTTKREIEFLATYITRGNGLQD